MPYQGALRLLQKAVKKYRLNAVLLDAEGRDGSLGENAPDPLLSSLHPEERTLYKAFDAYGFGYLYLLLPKGKEKRLLRIGPYLGEARSSAERLELFEQMGVAPGRQKYFNEHIDSIPVFAEGHPFFLLIDAFCEEIWKTASFAVADLKTDAGGLVFSDPSFSDGADVAVEMRTMETRYAFENELMAAVTGGQIQKENELLVAFSERAFEKRVTDPVRNAKNYAIIMNTLLRKAAEAGGVHPLYLDRISSGFAAQIEGLTAQKDSTELMREMFRGYCRLVRKHATGQLSPVVQRTVVLIDRDLSAELTLSALAEAGGVSRGYLSAAFKREMGKTLSEYVRAKRMAHAKKLLSTTHLQIQTVAAHCGLVDVQYFSKMFKAETGESPLAFRRAHKSGTR